MTPIHRNESSSLTSDVDDAATDQDDTDTIDSYENASNTNSTNSGQDSEVEDGHDATAAVGILKLDPPDVPNKNMLSTKPTTVVRDDPLPIFSNTSNIKH